MILRGDGDAAAWQREINRHYLPHALVLAIPTGSAGLPASLDQTCRRRSQRVGVPGRYLLTADRRLRNFAVRADRARGVKRWL